MTTPTVSELDEENIEGAVLYIDTGFGGKYEWVYGLSGSLVDGRKLTPHFDDDGDLQEMVSEMGDYYSRPIDSLIQDASKVLGYAESREEAEQLTRNHYEAHCSK